MALGFRLVHVGFSNGMAVSRIVAAGSAPMKRLKAEAKQAGRRVDASQGGRTRSIIVTDRGHVILSAIQTETLVQRLTSEEDSIKVSSG